MHNGIRSCAAAAALFLLTPCVLAQDPSVAAHLAAAKIAEARGELAAAEGELVAALEVATGADRVRVEQALQGLRQKLGKGGEPAPKQDGGDPVQRCIQALDTAEDNDAIAQLRSLGSLVVPQLLAALPKLGPFGVRNAVVVLAQSDDPRVQNAFEAAIDAADDRMVAAIAKHLDGMNQRLALGVAVRIAASASSRTTPALRGLAAEPATRLQALGVLAQYTPDDPLASALALDLVRSGVAAVQCDVLELLAKRSVPWAGDALALLCESTDPQVRGAAIARSVLADPAWTEDRLLAALDTMDRRQWWNATYAIGGRHPDWIRVASRVLAATAEIGPKDRVAGILGAWEWWRAPQVAAPVLVSAAVVNAAESQVWDQCWRMIAQGWRIPTQLEDAFAALAEKHSSGWSWVVEGLPADGEDRAVALAARLSSGARLRFLGEIAKAGRPWHRMIARQLASIDRRGDLDSALLAIDWTDAPPEAISDLVAFARRYPLLSGSGVDYRDIVIGAFTRYRNLPPEFLFPLVEDGSGNAWDAVVARDPHAALAWAARTDHLTESIAERAFHLLIQSGGDADLPLGIRLCRMGEFPGEDAGDNLANFLGAHGAGSLDAIRLGELPLPADGFTMHWCVTGACKAAEGARLADLPALLEVLPRLHGTVARVVLERLEGAEVGRAHTVALATALEPLLGPTLIDTTAFDEGDRRTFGDGNLVRHLCGLLGRTGDPAAEPVLRRAVERCVGDFAAAAARAALAVTADRQKLLADLLASTQPQVLTVAFGAGETAADPDLRGRAVAAMLRVRGMVDGIDEFARHLAEVDGVAFATGVLENPDLGHVGWPLVAASLQLLGSRKDVKFLPTLLHAAAHPHESVRNTLAIQLGNTFSRDAAPHLIEMLKDDNLGVRTSAQQALDQIANYLDQREKWEKRFGK